MTVAAAIELALVAILTGVVLAPVSWPTRVAALLLLGHVDVSLATGGTTAWIAGLATAVTVVKSILLPAWCLLVLALRSVHRSRLARLLRHPAVLLWLAVIVYAVAGAWTSPFPTDAAKFVAALGSHLLVFLVFALALSEHPLPPTVLARTLWLIFGLAVLQTFVLGNAFGEAAAAHAFRLTSFSSPQTFAEGVTVLGLLLLWQEGPRRPLLLVTVLVAVFLSGSRIGLLGALLGAAVWTASNLTRRRLRNVTIAILLMLLALPLGADRVLRSSRVGEVVTAVSVAPGSVVQQVGTFRWRAGMYAAVGRALAASSPQALAFGHGTSSAGLVGKAYDPRFFAQRFSANRVTHNEALRILYEGGVLAMVLYLILALTLAVRWLGAWPRLRGMRRPRRTALGAGLSVLPLAVLAGMFENVLQAAAEPGMMAFLLVVATLAAANVGPVRGGTAPGQEATRG